MSSCSRKARVTFVVKLQVKKISFQKYYIDISFILDQRMLFKGTVVNRALPFLHIWSLEHYALSQERDSTVH